MKRLVTLIAAAWSLCALGAGNDIAVEQRNAANNGWITRIMASPPAGASGILFYNGSTLLPGWLTLGPNLSIAGTVLTVSGTVGAQGPIGPQGPAGPQGAQGAAGPAGAAGATGDVGPQGPAGVAGPQGAKGDTGDAGPMGPQGAPGAAGPKGDTGVAGAVGQTGAVGPQGPQGVAGAQGPAGATGPKGDTGAVGATGAAGAQGIPGVPGTTGPTGPAGPAAFGAPTARAVALATAYQCSSAAKPCIVTITLQSQSAISLTGTNNNEGAVMLGSTAAVAGGTGAQIATYKNNLGGGLVVGLNLNSQQANTYTLAVPAGWYFAVRQTAGTGLQIVSAFDQVAGN